MQNCVNCGHQNRPGIIYCENCGASLLGEKPLSTKSIGAASEEEKAQLGIDSSVLTDVKVQGVSAFSIDDTLRLEIEGSPEPIIVKPKSETIFGRRDPATGAMPDVDLTPFAGYRMGVSRRHAAIRQGEEQSLNIWDLGSSNGTYLNGQKLTAHRPYRLHDGDELRLGQMMVRIRFQLGSEEPVVAVTETIGDQLDDVPPVVVKPEVAPPAVAKPADEKPPITDELPQAASKVASQAAASPAAKPATKPETNTETTTEAKTEAKTDAGTKPESSAQPANAKDPDSDQKPAPEKKPAESAEQPDPEQASVSPQSSEPPVGVQTIKAAEDVLSPVVEKPQAQNTGQSDDSPESSTDQKPDEDTDPLR